MSKELAMREWEIHASPEGKVDGFAMQLALLVDVRTLLLDVRTELQKLNAKSDAVIQAAVTARRRSWVRRLLETWR